MNRSSQFKNAYMGNNAYTDFLFSAIVSKDNDNAKSFSIEFGVNEGGYNFVTFDFEHSRVLIGNEAHEEIKSADYAFIDNEEYKIDLLVNDGVAKVYINGGDASVLLYRLSSYTSGKVGHDLEESHFLYHDESLTSLNSRQGDYFVLGYEVKKIVNLSDGNVTLSPTEYSVDAGVVKIKDDYLNTLEVDSEYKFRAVTSFTDFDFYVKTDEIGVEVAPQLSKYYRGNDVSFELSEPSRVDALFIDNEEYEFTINANKDLVTVSSSSLESLPSGEHKVKLFTDSGRPEAKFSLFSTVEVLPEVVPPVSHTFFFIDIGIFAALILGYVTFSQISKRAKRK